jgi:NAD(P)-dependent dehydrogenase (short-subunit alcohol dehydrogenase family)
MPAEMMSTAPATFPATRLVWGAVRSDRSAARSTAKLHGRRILVLGGDPSTASDVAKEVRQSGGAARVIAAGADAEAELDAIRDLGGVDTIVDLNISGTFALENAADWETPLLQSVRVLQACYGGWIREADAERLGYVVVTRMGGQMGYHPAGFVQPLGGLWAGLAKTLPQELPNCNVKVVDLSERDDPNAGEIVTRELYDWGLFEVAWVEGVRYTLGARCEPPDLGLPDMSERDTVLLSGGARGIGFKLATYLAGECRSRVIVTGRDAIPPATAVWAHIDGAAFRQYEWEELRRAARTRDLAATRRRLDRERNARDLVENLKEARARGLSIEYRQCDVTSAAAVTALARSVAASLTVVVHNAGVDTPVRLPSKTPDAVLQTVRTKVTGFVNLLQAVRHLPLRLFCNVGSLTGRWGGMTGETDYAAANECLSRLGMWSTGRFGFPVRTICWPTWDRVGMIKNFDVTGACMTPLDVDEGLAHWHRELRSTSPAEVAYVGNVGSALTPVQLKGFPAVPGMPNIDALHSRLHYLGRVMTFTPSQQMQSECEVSAGMAPLLTDFTVERTAAMPVSVLLEYVLAGAEWIQPASRRPMQIHAIREVECWLRRLRAPDGKYSFSREVRGSGNDDEWIVEVSISTEGQLVLRAELVYRADPRPAGVVTPAPHGGLSVHVDGMGDLRWRGAVFRNAEWAAVDDGVWVTAIEPGAASDAWATAAVPLAQLPATHLENTIRAAASLDWASGTRERLHINRISLYAAGEARHIVGGLAAGIWRMLDAEGRTSLEVYGLRFLRGSAPRDER